MTAVKRATPTTQVRTNGLKRRSRIFSEAGVHFGHQSSVGTEDAQVHLPARNGIHIIDLRRPQALLDAQRAVREVTAAG